MRHGVKRSVEFLDLIKTVSDHLSDGGTCQHLTGYQFILFNGQILVVDVRSYNGQDLMRLIKSNALNHDWTATI